MCHALLSHCRSCAWILHITYPHCSHALQYAYDPPQCPRRMKRRHVNEEVCEWCRTGDRSVRVDGEGSGSDSDSDNGKEMGLRVGSSVRGVKRRRDIGDGDEKCEFRARRRNARELGLSDEEEEEERRRLS
ncbi:hypothetical protein B0J11DRAFT_509086 [Dendryphion nanum]|uniref:Uncharacterized protein n=1 Tax=Dendryphion nanum TaxID=256645 RepID=A0A9P9DGU2_9PLEO|nr:hypothetical protein B0J11DRAFT_509086 [Dendryphion nanum]